MKHYTMIIASLLFAACGKEEVCFEVENSLDFARKGELVEITLPTGLDKMGKLVDAQGNEVAYQVTADGRMLFQANVEAQSKVTYKMYPNEAAAEVKAKTTAFFLGNRRKDDFAWENDKAAYRMYGPALLRENPSAGVDLWLKHSEDLTADAMYRQEEGGKPYHIDYGLGIDSYKVGHAAGCGGVAIVAGDEIWPGGPFAKYEILQEGPLQTIFRLSYDSVQVGDKKLTEVITITVNAGAQVNKAEVSFAGEAIEGMQVGGAVFLHDEIDNLSVNPELGTIAYCEAATSDKGIYGIHKKQGIDATQLDFGRNYVAVIVPGATQFQQYGITEVATFAYEMGSTFTYYFGGGWSKRDYATDAEWIEATRQTALALQKPLTVSLVEKK